MTGQNKIRTSSVRRKRYPFIIIIYIILIILYSVFTNVWHYKRIIVSNINNNFQFKTEVSQTTPQVTAAETWQRPSHTNSINLPIKNTISNINDKQLILSKDKRIEDSVSTSTTIKKNSRVTTITTTTTTATAFKRYDGVVIVTKVLGSKKEARFLHDWICFINHAYNDKVQYDILVFTTIPLELSDITSLQNTAKPANLTVAIEGPTLEEQLDIMTNDELNFLYKRCNTKENETLSWFSHCTIPNSTNIANLGYSWQSEFRAYHIWNHPALKDYKYMMWFDSDALVGRNWDIDPMKVMIENDLTVMYVGFPYGRMYNNSNVGKKLMNVYNTSICGIENVKKKHIYANVCNDPQRTTIQAIAGNHHITNLNIFRKDIHQQFLKSFIGDYRFNRDADDQFAVTIVGLMEQYIQNNYTTDVVPPSKYILWHERSNGLTLKIAHHGMYDVRYDEPSPKGKGFKYHSRFYKQNFQNWTGLKERCRDIIFRPI